MIVVVIFFFFGVCVCVVCVRLCSEIPQGERIDHTGYDSRDGNSCHYTYLINVCGCVCWCLCLEIPREGRIDHTGYNSRDDDSCHCGQRACACVCVYVFRLENSTGREI